jgi:hypothetical protein
MGSIPTPGLRSVAPQAGICSTANYQAIRRHRSTEQGGRLRFKQRESPPREIRNTLSVIDLHGRATAITYSAILVNLRKLENSVVGSIFRPRIATGHF